MAHSHSSGFFFSFNELGQEEKLFPCSANSITQFSLHAQFLWSAISTSSNFLLPFNCCHSLEHNVMATYTVVSENALFLCSCPALRGILLVFFYAYVGPFLQKDCNSSSLHLSCDIFSKSPLKTCMCSCTFHYFNIFKDLKAHAFSFNGKLKSFFPNYTRLWFLVT